MAVTHATTPFITIYKRAGDVFTKLANLTTLPTGTGIGVAFSSDDTYMAVAHDTTPFVTMYSRTAVPSSGFGVAFSNTGFPQ